MFIQGLGTAAPDTVYTQAQCWEALERSEAYYRLNSRARSIMAKVLQGDSGIATRRLALDNLQQAFEINPDALHARFARHAPELATQAARRALAAADLDPSAIDALLISTCTGYLCPGLSSYVGERLGLASGIQALDLVGQGCGAALPNFRAAESFLASGRSRQVLSICVEVCSAAFFLDNDPGVLISACLFGDGAGAAVLGRETRNGNRSIRWARGATVSNPAVRDLLRLEQRSGMLRNLLSPRVPSLAAEHVETVVADLIGEAKLGIPDIAGWVMHPGGRDVLIALRDRLNLGPTDLRWSEKVLREYGNLSSASVYFVLAEALRDSGRSGIWLLSSFGAGFACHGALLEVE